MYFFITFDLFNDENGSVESAALLGIINCIFKCVCPDTVYQNKRTPSYCLKHDSLNLFVSELFFVFSFTFSLFCTLLGTVACFRGQV